MKRATVGLGALFVIAWFFCGLCTWAVASELRPRSDREVKNTVNDDFGFSDGQQAINYGDARQEVSLDPVGAGYKNQTQVKLDAKPYDGREALAPAGNLFKYDAFGRIVEKQVALE